MNEVSSNASDRLIALNDELLEVYKALLSVARKKQGLLVNGSIKELESLISSEERLLWRAGKVEEERQSVLEGPGLRASSGDLNPKTQETLAAVAEELIQINKANMDLVRQALQQVEVSLELARKITSPGYGSDGKSEDSAGAKVVNKQV